SWSPRLCWGWPGLRAAGHPAVRLQACFEGSSTTETRPTIRAKDGVTQKQLCAFGEYVAEILPTYVQQVQLKSTYIYKCRRSLSDLSAADVRSRQYGFEIVYNLLSLHFSSWICVKTDTGELTPIVSIVRAHGGAN
uniref:Uncharacterized protein n=1 Tax=Pelusios castaneus TaxID=367368 RepID=A0A8C8S9Q7_9SAUR